jgi:hypothetical protein
MNKNIQYSVTAEIDATVLFENHGVDWEYCKKHGTFQHKEACEFVLHIGTERGKGSYVETKITEMKEFGCTHLFMGAYLRAAEQGAVRVLFYA